MALRLCRTLAPVVIAAATVASAHAQQNPNCPRLEAQLQAFDRGGGDPGRSDQIRRYQESIASQQSELERQQALAQRSGCGRSGFFVLFSNEPAQCGPLKDKISQMRGNLENMQSEVARLQDGGNPERDAQRRSILVALAQNSCGQQYNAALAAASSQQQQQRGGLFESLFGRNTVAPPESGAPGWSVPTGSYRTICVRTCDGYYYPISFATDPSHFADDEKTCQKSCPASEVMLFAHRNPGEDVSQAVSTGGQLYSTLPNAFKYRQAFDNACSCRRAGESWAHALKGDDSTVERGDIVVNEQRARQMSQPRVDAQGKPLPPPPRTPAAKPSAQTVNTAAPDTAKTDEPAAKPDPNRPVRAVGPTFLPSH